MLAGFLVLHTIGIGAAAAEPTEWGGVFAAYGRDPARNRHALLALERRMGDDVPPHVQLLLGDAALRSGLTQLAAERFAGLVASDPGEPWLSFARMALGWTALLRDDAALASEHFAAAAGTPQTRIAARVALGFAVAFGDPTAGRELLEETAAREGIDDDLRDAALLASAYASYWAGHPMEARRTLDALLARVGERRLADDARYAAAWMTAQSGDADGAIRELEVVAAQPAALDADRLASNELVTLRPRGLVRDGFRRYRRSRLVMADQQVVAFLDRDAAATARAALRRLAAAGDDRPSATARHHDDGIAAAVPQQAPDGWSDGSRTVLWIVLILGVLAVIGAVASGGSRAGPAVSRRQA